VVLFLGVCFFHPFAIRDRRPTESEKGEHLHIAFQNQNSLPSANNIGTTAPAVDISLRKTGPLQTITTYQLHNPLSVTDGTVNSSTELLQANPKPFGSTPIPTDPTLPNATPSSEPPGPKISLVCDVIRVCKILWSEVQGLRDHGVGLAVALTYVYFINILQVATGSVFVILAHPVTWSLLGLARGLSFIGCIYLTFVLSLVFSVLGLVSNGVSVYVIHQSRQVAAKSKPKETILLEFIVPVGAAVLLYSEYAFLDCGRQETGNTIFVMDFCR